MKLLRTPWKILTTEETNGTLVLSVGIGKMYLENERDGDTMVVNYRAVSLGNGKGPPVGAAWSNKTDPSGGFDNVGVVPGRYFGPLAFPCRGYLIGVGASSGVVGSILGMDVTGGGVTAVVFGIWPAFAGVRIWGLGRGVLPGAGFTAGLTHFFLDE